MAAEQFTPPQQPPQHRRITAVAMVGVLACTTIITNPNTLGPVAPETGAGQAQEASAHPGLPSECQAATGQVQESQEHQQSSAATGQGQERPDTTGPASLHVLDSIPVIPEQDGHKPAFPLKLSADGSHLVGQNNEPFYYTADTAWTMLSELSIDDAKRLIDIRAAQGFDTIQTILTPWGARGSGIRGMAFEGGDITQPLEEYFKGADEIIKYAESKGMLLYVVPLWMAQNGGWDKGGLQDGVWREPGKDYSPVPAVAAMQTYMRWVGERYKHQNNIMWAIGGDDEADRNRAVKSAGAMALHQADPGKPITYHPRWNDYRNVNAPWYTGPISIQANDSTVQNYDMLRRGVEINHKRPIIDVEPQFEPHTAMQPKRVVTAQDNRSNGWDAALSGAAGVAYGGPEGAWAIGDDGASPDWQRDICRPQAAQTALIGSFMKKIPSWNRLEPDWDSQVITGGRGEYGTDSYAPAAAAPDGTVVAYTPGQSLEVTLRPGEHAQLVWVDPTSGRSRAAMLVTGTGSHTVATPGANRDGSRDWVLTGRIVRGVGGISSTNRGPDAGAQVPAAGSITRQRNSRVVSASAGQGAS